MSPDDIAPPQAYQARRRIGWRSGPKDEKKRWRHKKGATWSRWGGMLQRSGSPLPASFSFSFVASLGLKCMQRQLVIGQHFLAPNFFPQSSFLGVGDGYKHAIIYLDKGERLYTRKFFYEQGLRAACWKK
nr:hypothetical protein [Pandoravirus massiliensis]